MDRAIFGRRHHRPDGGRLLYFYTTFCGLTPIEATFIFAMARVLDAVISPLMGFLTDNFGSTGWASALAAANSLFCSAFPAYSATA